MILKRINKDELMNEYLKNLERIEFVVTMACTGRCKHCSEGEHKSFGESIDKFVAAEAIRKIAKEYKIKSVMTFGGEPLLSFETVCEIHKAAKEMNIPNRQLITNGYFSKDYNKIKAVSDLIVESGVNDILLSVDAFHQEIIPLKYVKSFAECIKNRDVQFRINPAWLISENNDNPYNNKTKEILEEFRKDGIDSCEGNVIFPSGNALKYLNDYFNDENETINPYVQNPFDISAICIGSRGDVLGENIYKKDILKILSDYKPIKTV